MPASPRPTRLREHVYFDRQLNDMVYKLETMFPTADQLNLGIVITSPAVTIQVLGVSC